MEFVSTPVCLPEEAIHKKARGKGGLLGKIVLFKRPLTLLRLEYLKFYRMTLPYDVTVRVFPAKRRELTGSIEVIVDAMTGKCAVNNGPIHLEKAEGSPFMDGRYDVGTDEALQIAENFANRIVTRLTKGIPRFGECEAPEYFYRPHYIAYYGEPESPDCRFLHFEADGQTFKR